MSYTFAAHARIMTARSAGKTDWEWSDLVKVSDLGTIGGVMPQGAGIRAEAPWVRPDRYADRLKWNRAAEWQDHSTGATEATPLLGSPWLPMACHGTSSLPAPRLAG